LERRKPQNFPHAKWKHRRDVWVEFEEELKFMGVLLKCLEEEKIKVEREKKHEIESLEKKVRMIVAIRTFILLRLKKKTKAR